MITSTKQTVLLLLTLVLLLLLTAIQSHAKPFVVMNLGNGGNMDATSLGAEFGTTDGFGGYAGALELVMGFTNDVDGDDLLDYDVPHGNYTDLGWQDKGVEFGAMLKMGKTYGPICLLGGVGAGFQDKVRVARSNATGWLYTQEDDTKVNFMWSAGARVLLDRVVISAEYNNHRGVVGGLGISF